LLLLSAISGLELACYEDSLFEPHFAQGLTRVFLTDAPFPLETVGTVEVYVVEISASTDPDSTAGWDSWTSLATTMQRFDLVQLQQSNLALVGDLVLQSDVYRSLRVTIDSDSSIVTHEDGAEAKVLWPYNGPGPVFAYLPAPIVVPDSGASIVIDFDLGQSLVSGLGDTLHDFLFTPRVRAVDGPTTGSISGTILGDSDGDGIAEPVRHARISAHFGDSVPGADTDSRTVTGCTDSTGYYKIGFLHPASYALRVDPAAETFGTLIAYDIEVGVGEDFIFSVTLPAGSVAGNPFWR